MENQFLPYICFTCFCLCTKVKKWNFLGFSAPIWRNYLVEWTLFNSQDQRKVWMTKPGLGIRICLTNRAEKCKNIGEIEKQDLAIWAYKRMEYILNFVSITFLNEKTWCNAEWKNKDNGYNIKLRLPILDQLWRLSHTWGLSAINYQIKYRISSNLGSDFIYLFRTFLA